MLTPPIDWWDKRQSAPKPAHLYIVVPPVGEQGRSPGFKFSRPNSGESSTSPSYSSGTV
jgi:hypothetical protein